MSQQRGILPTRKLWELCNISAWTQYILVRTRRHSCRLRTIFPSPIHTEPYHQWFAQRGVGNIPPLTLARAQPGSGVHIPSTLPSPLPPPTFPGSPRVLLPCLPVLPGHCLRRSFAYINGPLMSCAAPRIYRKAGGRRRVGGGGMGVDALRLRFRSARYMFSFTRVRVDQAWWAGSIFDWRTICQRCNEDYTCQKVDIFCSCNGHDADRKSRGGHSCHSCDSFLCCFLPLLYFQIPGYYIRGKKISHTNTNLIPNLFSDW